jgi:tetratricopeptide (TPR) repeat protein
MNVFVVLLVIPMQAQNIGEVISKQLGIGNPDIISEARMNLKLSEIDKATSLYSQTIIQAQMLRNAGQGVGGDLLAEYSYVLALHHDFEAALMNIDRARMVGTKYGDFYAAQVLAVMGYKDAAQQLMRQVKVPEWINGIYQGLNEKYKTRASINRDAPETALKRANKLAANRQTIQAIALFEELVVIYPTTYIIYVNYSTLWESLGYYAYAAQLLQKGIDLMPQEQSRNKQIFQNHLAKVNQMKATSENASWMKRLLGMNPPKLMTYVGASAAKDMYSLNGRMGLYTSNRFSASVNVGLNYASEQFSGSIGVSGYKAWGIFVGGLGITDMFGKDTNTFSLTPSIGLSFLNKSQTSSFDIMVNGYIPFSSEQKFSYSISVGKTIYFDLNGLLK